MDDAIANDLITQNAALREHIAELEAAIKDAPCPKGICHGFKDYDTIDWNAPCDCWKRDALSPVPLESSRPRKS